MADRPDDLIAEAARWRYGGRVGTASALIAGLAGALEAAQKERDELRERLSASVERAFDAESDLQARVRQLEEALSRLADELEDDHGTKAFEPECGVCQELKAAREVLAAKENTTP